MKHPILSMITMLLVASANAADTITVTGASVTEVGIYSAETKKKFDVPSVVGGTTEGLDDFRLIRATTNIPARIGTRFGFRYAIQGSPTNAPIVLTMVGEHPPMKDPRTGKTQTRDVYRLQSWIGHTYTSYSLDEPWELVHGNWRFEVWHDRRKLCEQSFLVGPDKGDSNKAGAANGSQPIRSETNPSSSAAGSLR